MTVRSGERGNIFFTLFGAIALVGVVGVATSTLLRGPVGTVLSMNQKAKIDSQLQIARKLSALESAQAADCDGDEFIEPLAPDTAGSCNDLLGAGTGCLPATVGAAKQDAWGTSVGYCGWNHGPTTVDAGCADRFAGAGDTTNVVLAVISAGPDRTFQTTCADDPAYITKGGDDVVFEWTYEEASAGLGGGLWSLKSGDPDAITTGKNVEFASGTTASFGNDVTAEFGAGSRLDLGLGGLFSLPDETVLQNGDCNAANRGVLRRQTSGGASERLEICDGTTWQPVTGAAGTPAGGANGQIQYNSGGILDGDNALTWNPATNALTVTGTAGISGNATVGGTLGVTGATSLSTLGTSGLATLNSASVSTTLGVTGATTLSSTLGVTGAATLSSTLGVTGATTLGNTLSVAGDISDPNSAVIIGDTLNATGAVDFDSTLNVDGAATLVSTLSVAGAISDPNSDVIIGDGLNTTGAVDFDTTLNVDGAAVLQTTLNAKGAVDFDTTLNLDGIMNFGATGQVSGGACTAAGQVTFDAVNDELLLCSSVAGSKWVTIGTSGGGGGGAGTVVPGNDGEITYNTSDSLATSTTFVYTAATGNLGIGTAAPSQRLHLAADAEDGVLLTIANNATSSNPFFQSQRSRGTLAAPTIVANNDELFEFLVYGYDGTAYRHAAIMAFNVDGTPGASDMPTRLDINLQADGAGSWLGDGASTPEITIKSTGFVGIGTGAPSALLHVKRQATTNAYNEALMIEGDGEPAVSLLSSSATAALNPLFYTTRSRGTRTAKTIVSSGDSLFEWQVMGYDGAADRDAAYMRVVVDGTPGASDMPGRIEFQTQADGAGALVENSTPEMVIKNDGKVGIGTASPSSILTTASNVEDGLRIYQAAANDAHNPYIWSFRSKGTVAAPAAVDIDTVLMEQIISGYDGDSYESAVHIAAVVDGVVGDEDMPTRYEINVQPDGSSIWMGDGASVPEFVIKSNGSIGMGDASPDSGTGGQLKLDVEGNVGASAYCDASGNNCFTAGGGGATTIDGLTDAYTDYAAINNIIIGRAGAAALTAGARFNLFIGQGAGATTANSTATTSNNTAIGFLAMGALTSGSSNIAVGGQALGNNTTGAKNVAMGDSALISNVTKQESVAIGYSAMEFADSAAGGAVTYNTGLGAYALRGSGTPGNNTGVNNTAVGHSAMIGNTSGNQNTAVGVSALSTNTTGENNTAIGFRALRLADRSDNTAVGAGALAVTTTGADNTAVGSNALTSNTTGRYNTAVGYTALQSNKANEGSTAVGYGAMLYANDTTTAVITGNSALGVDALRGSTTAANNTGTLNTAIGHSAMRNNTSGGENTAVGAAAMDSNTTGQLNTVVGYNSMYFNTTGSQNTAIGHNAMQTNVARSQSTAVGYEAMRYADSGAAATTFNTAVGFQALRGSTTPANNTAIHNTAIGHGALLSVTSANENTALGARAMNSNTTGDQNTALGATALYSTTGNWNVAVGASAGSSLTSGDSNILIGYDAEAPTATTSNHLNIGNTIYADLSTDMVGIGTASPSKALTVSSGVADDGLLIDIISAGGGAKVNFQRARGTSGALAIVQSGDTLGQITPLGYDGAAYNSAADITFSVDGTPGAGGDMPGRISFRTKPDNAGGLLTRMIIKNDGAIGIGTTTPNQGALEVKGGTVCVDTNSDDNASSCIATESDMRLKKNVRDLGYSVETLMKLRPVEFDWKHDDPEILKHYPLIARFAQQPHSIGFLAQDVQKLVPEAIESETVGDAEVQYLQLDYAKLVPVMVKAAQEQQGDITTLKAENEKLKTELAQVKTILTEMQNVQKPQPDSLQQDLIDALKEQNELLKAELPQAQAALAAAEADIEGLKAYTSYNKEQPLIIKVLIAAALLLVIAGAVLHRRRPNGEKNERL